MQRASARVAILSLTEGKKDKVRERKRARDNRKRAK